MVRIPLHASSCPFVCSVEFDRLVDSVVPSLARRAQEGRRGGVAALLLRLRVLLFLDWRGEACWNETRLEMKWFPVCECCAVICVVERKWIPKLFVMLEMHCNYSPFVHF